MRWKKPPQLWRLGSSRVILPPPEVKVVCPTEFMAKRLRADGIRVDAVLDNFVPDLSGVKGASENERDYIAFVGMVEPHKGPATLLEAFSRSRDMHGFDLYIVGEGSLRERLAARVKELGVSDRVKITGYVSREDMLRIMSGSNCVIVPSEWPENASLVVREALSLGVPVLASDQGALPETVGGDSGSSIFRAGSIDNLSEARVRLWNTRSELGTRRRKARTAYEKMFSPDVHIAQYLGIVGHEKTGESRGA
jgi:glycosyltransferase involved in cell wall biosynthesis